MNGDQYDPIVSNYRPRITALMDKLAEAINKNGFQSSKSTEMYGDTYVMGLDVSVKENGTPDVRVDFSIIDMEDFKQQKDDEIGLNFRIDVVQTNGLILSTYSPFNYTEQCWVNAHDPNAVEERFKIIEQIPPQEIIQSLNDFQPANRLEATRLIAKILATMDVPATRLGDYHWLLRNIGIRNTEHPKLMLAINLIKGVLKWQW